MSAWKPPHYKKINGVPHIRIRSGAYRRIHEIVGGLLDGAVQIKTRRKWKWLKGPRKRPQRAVTMQKAAALPVRKIAAQTRPRGYEIVVWANKYRELTIHRPSGRKLRSHAHLEPEEDAKHAELG